MKPYLLLQSYRHFVVASLVTLIASSSTVFAKSTFVEAEKSAAQKEWTLLVFLNGNNSLDSFGDLDINEMEKVGSSKDVNVVVQWASRSGKFTKRMLVKKDADELKVTSPIISQSGPVDMGDWKKLVEFVEWGVKNYPAKRYFIDVWNHGSGWHLQNGQWLKKTSGGIGALDISFDDNTGNKITTEQLGVAMSASAKIIGHKVDLYGSDACLMAMVEVAGEMADSTLAFVGSEDLEPGKGWPYDALLARWVKNPAISGLEVGKILAEEYTKSYSLSNSRGSQGISDVTMSVFDLSKYDAMVNSLSEFAIEMKKIDSTALIKMKDAAKKTFNFYMSDYRDLLHFLALIDDAGIVVDRAVTAKAQTATQDFVTTNSQTGYPYAYGAMIWMPVENYTYNDYSERYSNLKFAKATGWGDIAALIAKTSGSEETSSSSH